MRVYYELVGRGAGAIINLTPDSSGRIPDNLVAAAREMGAEIDRRFSRALAQTSAKGPVATLEFGGARRIDHLVTMEEQARGQKIARYRIEARIDGRWKTVVEGQTVGHKRIDRIAPIMASALRFVCVESVEEPVSIRNFAAYDSAA
jgi:alpha-L-fucosidase